VTDQYEIPRDRYGRPMIVPPDGGKPVPYARASSFGDVLDDKTNLSLWKQRMTALGLVERPDLLLSVAANRENKSELNKISEMALDHAHGNAKATVGTALHSLTENIDRGQETGFVPEAYRADLDAYQWATEGFEMELIERFVVNDGWKIAGTPDRVVKYRGEFYIWDLKTGSVDYSWAKIAVQLAVYAGAVLYMPPSTEASHVDRLRAPMPEISPDKGIVCHLPSGSGQASLYWVDLNVGRRGIGLASQVKDWRTSTRKGVATPLNHEELVT
jgi:predicted RecB family endonuclease